MLCCVGLIGGMAVGQSLGGPWTYIAPAAGFGIGFLADMKFMHKMHNKGDQQSAMVRASNDPDPVLAMETDESKAQHQSRISARVGGNFEIGAANSDSGVHEARHPPILR